jgi:hypothetical protein
VERRERKGQSKEKTERERERVEER